MRTYFSILCLGLLCIFPFTPVPAQITTREDEVGNKLKQWAREGTANGLNGVYYENRDALHSPLDLNVFPQVQAVEVPQEHIERKLNVGPANQVRSWVNFGNCSMSAMPEQGGSLPRLYMTQAEGMQFLTAQYYQNNLFVYPEHHDYDMGENGNDGLSYGDLYPTNTPYMLISQGSSFSDIPFLKAFMSAYAAMSKDIQQGLTSNKMVMPMLQSLFRQSSKLVENEDDYLSGKAHPVVFDWNQVDEMRFVKRAHELTAQTLPPVAVIDVKEESKILAGKDFFEPFAAADEALASTPSVVARIFRGAAYEREVILDASRSGDLFKRPVKFRWVLLQGDPERVKIEPSEDGKTAKVKVAWHPPFKNSVGMTTRRVEIGLFVSNGSNWSAPAFFTYYMLPNEQRYYDASGRLAEIYYNAWNLDLGLPQTHELKWLTLGRRLGAKSPDLAHRLLAEKLPAEVIEKLRTLANAAADDQVLWRQLQEIPEKKPAADKVLEQLHNKIGAVVRGEYVPGKSSIFDAVKAALQQLLDQADLFQQHQTQILSMVKREIRPESKAIFDHSLKRVIDLQVVDAIGSKFALRYQPSDLIAGEKYQMQIFNLNLFSEVLFAEFLQRRAAPELSDPRLSVPKEWRDMYRYDKAGKCFGWTRISNGKTYEFDLDGRLLPQGRGGKAVEVIYKVDQASKSAVFVPKN